MQVKQADTRAYIKQQEDKGLAPGTIKRQLSLLSASLNFSKTENKIDFAPVIVMPEEPPPKDRWLTKDEANRLLAACIERHTKLFVAIALYCGQRRGAILDLKWQQVNFTNGQISFNPPGRVQTAKKRVPVNMNGEFRPLMQKAYDEWQEAQKKGMLWAGSDYVVSYRGRGKDGRLADIGKGVEDACTRAELTDVTPHTFKHTCGTWLAQAGVPMWQISGILGHSLARTTELYLHHHPDYLKEATEAIKLAC
jgi:integrase